jgi:hypothetical protein
VKNFFGCENPPLSTLIDSEIRGRASSIRTLLLALWPALTGKAPVLTCRTKTSSLGYGSSAREFERNPNPRGNSGDAGRELRGHNLLGRDRHWHVVLMLPDCFLSQLDR